MSTIAAAALLLSACADPSADEDSSPTPTGETSQPAASPTAGATTGAPATAAGQQWSTCEHSEGIVVSYPAGWQVNQGRAGALPACSAFDPAALQIPAGQETFDAAVLLSVDPVDFAAAVDPETIPGEVLDRSEAFVDGHDAVRIETRSEGNALLPEGGRSTRWFVVFGRESTLSLVTHEVGPEDDYETERQILDQMVRRLSCRPTAEPVAPDTPRRDQAAQPVPRALDSSLRGGDGMAWTKTATRLSVILMLLFGSILTDPFLTPASGQSLLLMWARGPDVADWQRSLNEAREDNIAVDGIFGPQTARATREFQRGAGI